MVKHGKTKQWIVGHLEKTQTHLRTKPGSAGAAAVTHFANIDHWPLTWEWEFTGTFYKPGAG
eukprot:5745767-Amphidinium_carterae.1